LTPAPISPRASVTYYVLAMPQLYAIPAAEAPVAVVIAHQGAWFHLARWDLETGKLERGAWFKGRIYQRRCDISPDGSFLYYLAMKGGKTFSAISRVPWMTALALWFEDTTYSRGWHFAPDGRADRIKTDQGSLGPLADRYGLDLRATLNGAYDAERRRGWIVKSRRSKSDPWGEKPQWLIRDQPGGECRLELRDDGYVRGRLEGRVPRYTLDGEPLEDVVWADWGARGRLIVTTRAGTAEIRSSRNKPKKVVSLADWEPDPRPPPGSARRW